MKINYSPNCEKETGLKRALGCGISLLLSSIGISLLPILSTAEIYFKRKIKLSYENYFERLMMTNLSFLLLSLFLLPTFAIAQMYDVEIIGEYVMGDSDTKTEARKIALEHAKRLAAEQIGTYLESETVVKNRLLTKDEIRTYTSAIIKTTVLSENITLLEGKTTVLKILIRANVDIGVLEKKIKEIKADTKRKEQIDALQAENLRLLRELESLSTQLKIEKASEYKTLRQKRENLFDQLEKNQNSIRIAFEKGTLLNLALKSKDELEEQKRNIDDALQFIADNTKFTIGKPEVRYKGNKADLLIKVDWRIERLYEGLEKINLFYLSPEYWKEKWKREKRIDLSVSAIFQS